MSAQGLDAALTESSSKAPNRRLNELAAHNDAFSGDKLLTTAQNYLQVLCDPAVSPVQRRWVGLTLRKLVATLKDPVNNLETLSHLVPRLGAAILCNSELEETKIVVGIVMREMLKNGVPFNSFWAPETISNNVPHFPQEDGHTWMNSFQTFLDAFNDLKLLDLATDPVILYPISLSASDGFKWRSSEPVDSVSIIQNENLTIIAPDVAMQHFVFVDVPLSHIQYTFLRESSLHDSQARTTEYKPWDLVLNFKRGSWTYRVNDIDKSGNELTILFAHHRDAQECQGGIVESNSARLQSSLRKTSSSQAVLDIGSVDKAKSHGQARDKSSKVEPAQDLSDAPIDENRISVTKSLTESNRTDKHGEALLEAGSDHPELGLRTPVLEAIDASRTTTKTTSSPTIPKRLQRKARGTGALPKIKKAQRPSGAPKIGLGGREDAGGEFAFPDESPRMRRPTKKPKQLPLQKTTIVANNNARGKLKPIAPKARAKPKIEPIQERVNDTGDDENPLHSHGGRNLAQAPNIPDPKARNTARGSKQVPILAHPKLDTGYTLRSSGIPSRLDRMQETKGSRQERKSDDLFAIPSDDGPVIETLDKRRRVKDKDYNKSELSSSGNSELGSVKFMAKQTRAANRQPQTSQSSKKANTNKSGRKYTVSKVSTKKTRLKKNEQTASFEKHNVLASLLSSSGPDRPLKSMADSRTPIQRKYEGIHGPITSGDEINSQICRNPYLMIDHLEISSEADILERLNNNQTEEEVRSTATARETEHGIVLCNDLDNLHSDMCTNVCQEDDTTMIPTLEVGESITGPLKKSASEPRLLLTPKVKRTKKNISGVGDETSRVNMLDRQATFAPPRLIRDPSSPCADASHARVESTGSSNAQNVPDSRTLELSLNIQSDANERKRKSCPSQEGTFTASLDKQQTRRHTPIHQPIVRTQSDGSVNLELLSSNSKPLPAPPQAPSGAISGHAESNKVELEITVGRNEIARSDPFTHTAKRQKKTGFIRRLTEEPAYLSAREVPQQPLQVATAVTKDTRSPRQAPQIIHKNQKVGEVDPSRKDLEDPRRATQRISNEHVAVNIVSTKQPFNSVSKKGATKHYILSDDTSRYNLQNTQVQEHYGYCDQGVNLEGDTTIVAKEHEPKALPKTSTVCFRSSPLAHRFSHSSRSSTSAGLEDWHELDMGTQILTDEAEEREWQQGLQPHQRGISEQLIHLSRRVLRNIIDNETAVQGIADTYATDGQSLLTGIYDRNNSHFQSILGKILTKKGTMRSALNGVAMRLKRGVDLIENEFS